MLLYVGPGPAGFPESFLDDRLRPSGNTLEHKFQICILEGTKRGHVVDLISCPPEMLGYVDGLLRRNAMRLQKSLHLIKVPGRQTIFTRIG